MRRGIGRRQLLLLGFAIIQIAFVGVALPAACADASGSASEDTTLALKRQLADTDRALLAELVRLAKFSIHFHLEANHHQKWRVWAYPLGRESGTALAFAATLIDLRQQAQGLDNPRRISRGPLKTAVACGIVGNALSGGASALELAQNAFEMLKANRNGFSPGRSIAFVKGIVANTDRLLETRDRLAAQVPSAQARSIVELETQLVRRIRQQLIFEFGNWSCHSRDLAWRENTFYTLDSMQSFTRMAAGIVAREAFGRPILARDATVCALVSASVATVNPIVSNVIGMTVRKHHEHRLSKVLPFARPPVLSPELADLQQQLSTDIDRRWLRKVSLLASRSVFLDAQLDRETRDIERYRQVAQQQSISGPLIGLTGVGGATLATVAAYDYLRVIKTANKLAFAGRITQGTGQAYALLNTPYTIISGMIKNRHLRKRWQLPEQILEERLRFLDTLETGVP